MGIQHLSSKRFHQRGIRDGFLNFEEGETTISHFLRDRHPFLRGRSYGEAFYDAVKGFFGRDGFGNVLEIGGGCGYFASSFIRRWKKVRSGAKSYTILDLSPELIRTQKKTLSRAPLRPRWLKGSAQDLRLTGRFQGLVIANEMIGDLDVLSIDAASKKNGRLPSDARTLLARYGGDWQKKHRQALFPYGVARMLERLRAGVSDDSRIVLTEYFDRSGAGRPAVQVRHQEFALSLEWVIEIARKAGFSVRTLRLVDFLGLNITHACAIRGFLRVGRDRLGYDLSTSDPMTSSKLARKLGLRHPKTLAPWFTRAEFWEFIAPFYALILRPQRRLSEKDFRETLQLEKEPGVMLLRAKDGAAHLVRDYPIESFELSPVGEIIWESLDGNTSLGRIADILSSKFHILRSKALQDTLDFARQLTDSFLAG